LASSREVTWIKESDLRTDENKAAIQVYHEKTSVELSRREEEAIRHHAARDID
jgi:hypothetical protein